MLYYELRIILFLQPQRKTLMNNINNTIKQVDIVPIIQYFMKELNVHELFNEHIPSAVQAQVKPADLLCVLVTNIMVAASPLYHVEKWVAKYADGCVP